MKRIIYMISTAIFLFAGYSCTTEVDDVFENTATERLDKSLNECRTLLLAAPNGWTIDYYPGLGQPYGGVVVLAQFSTNGEVTVSGEIVDPGETVTSHFSLNTSNSVTLTFDTYNEIFHYFSDPDVGGGVSAGGDFEFTYVGGTSSELLFKGTKTGNTVRFTALDEGQGWAEYLEGIIDVRTKVAVSPNSSYVWNKGGANEKVFDVDDNYSILTYVVNPDNPDVTESVAFCYTPEGIRLYSAIELDGKQILEFLWDEVQENFNSIDASIVLEGQKSELYIPYDDFLGDWIFSYDEGFDSDNVKIVENVRGVSFVLTGLDYDLKLDFSKKTGNLSLTVQYVGRYFNYYYVFFCPWDTDEGYLTWGTGFGFDLIHNRDADNPAISFVDNGEWAGYNISGFLFYAFTSPTASNSTAAGSVAQYPYVVGLHK